MSPYERARLWLQKREPAQSGQRGHDQTFGTATTLLRHFDLSEEEALRLLLLEFNPRCSPPWHEAELRRKVREASRAVSLGERGTHLFSQETRGGASQGGGGRAQVAPPPAKAPDSQPTYPPLDEVLDLWNRCARPVDHPFVFAWLLRRGLDPYAVTDLDLCRGLPKGRLPWWAARRNVSWNTSGHQAAFLAYSPDGEPKTLHLRYVGTREVDAKALHPNGHPRGLSFSYAGVAFLCPMAQSLLHTKEPKESPWHWRRWWLLRGGTVVIVEGAPDWMRAVLSFAEANEFAPATFGVLGGGWTSDFSRRLHPGLTISLATDRDDTGWSYAKAIWRTLGPSSPARILRWYPIEWKENHPAFAHTKDLDDYIKAGGQFAPLCGPDLPPCPKGGTK